MQVPMMKPLRLIVALASLTLCNGIPSSLVAQVAATPPGCTAAEFRAFDYWVGEWTVSDTTGKHMAASTIARVSGDCAIAEHWRPINGPPGESLSWYEPRDKQWHQQWVGGAGWIARFAGAPDNGEMVLTEIAHSAAASAAPLSRMRYVKRSGGVVRQLLWQSSDAGESWKLVFAADYTPTKK